jgi:diguanylate cyclase (GGDEF)-like protein/PAS domain S-box-containing protein
VSSQIFDSLFTGLLEPLQSTTQALSISDAMHSDFPLIRVNAPFSALTGYRQSDVIGRNYSFLQGPRTDAVQTAKLRQAVINGNSARAVIWNYRRDGTPFLNEIILNPVRDGVGTVRYFTGLHRDISAPTDQLVNRVRFSLLPDASVRALDHPTGLGKEWMESLSLREQCRLANAAARVASATPGGQLVIKLRMEKMHCGEIYEELKATFSTHEEAAIFDGVLAKTAQDAALLGRLRLLDAVMTSATDVIIITEAEPLDRPGPRILYVNDAAQRCTGYTADQMIGRNPRMLQGPATDRAATRLLGQQLRQWRPVSAQLLNYRADNSTFQVDLSINPVADEYGWWTHWISIQRDETDRRSAADRIAFQAAHDSLTGLANRRRVSSVFEAFVKAPTSQLCGVLQVDLDHFKSINDTFGHAAGDAVLVETARRLRDASRAGDTVARIGGDEFFVIMPGFCNEELLAQAAERIRTAVTGKFAWNDQELEIRVSIGAAAYPQDASNLEQLMIAADVSLYQAKQQGRNCISVFNAALREEVDTFRELGSAMRVALKHNEFEVHFQPQVRISDRAITGFEALVRWRHPRRGLLAPGAFLPAAAQAGLMAELDEFVFGRVLSAAEHWKRAGLDFGRLGVNMSGDSFANPQFADLIKQRLKDCGVSPEQIAIEMVESVFIGKDTKEVTGKLAALREIGISIDLDDFGTGYAALIHLRKFQIDRIKVDRSFISELGKDADNDVIVSAIVKLAQNLGLRCIAEGVETTAQLEFLRNAGCDEVQGYLFSKPMPEQAVAAWIKTHAADARAECEPAAVAV